jgi:site-specific DNA-methyltransferase (adenine-specific)
VTERVVVASKGRFGRALSPKDRRAAGLPFESSIGADDFMSLTLDVWEFPPESAVRVRHPAPFPVELPLRLMELYTYRGDLVVDPFCGSGSTLVAALRCGRDAVGYDLDPSYVAIAEARVAKERAAQSGGVMTVDEAERSVVGAGDGTSAAVLARQALGMAGFKMVRPNRRLRGLGMTVSFSAEDATGRTWYFDLAGVNSAYRGGMARSETVWRTLGRTHVMAANGIGPLIVLTTQLPRAGTEADRALRAAGPGGIFDAVDLLSPAACERLSFYAAGRAGSPLPGFWSASDLAPGRV